MKCVLPSTTDTTLTNQPVEEPFSTPSIAISTSEVPMVGEFPVTVLSEENRSESEHALRSFSHSNDADAYETANEDDSVYLGDVLKFNSSHGGDAGATERVASVTENERNKVILAKL